MSAIRKVTIAIASLALTACSLLHSRPSAEILFPGTTQQLAPHADGDEFVVSFSGPVPASGIYLERVSRTSTPNVFVVSLYRGKEVVAEFHLIDDGTSIGYQREVLFEQNLGFAYERPLPYVFAPLDSRPRQMSTPVEIYRPSDGQPLARGSIDFSFQARPLDRGPFGEQFEIRQRRRVHMGREEVESETVMVISPGVGEVRTISDRIESTLLCATLSGHRVGSCDQ